MCLDACSNISWLNISSWLLQSPKIQTEEVTCMSGKYTYIDTTCTKAETLHWLGSSTAYLFTPAQYNSQWLQTKFKKKNQNRRSWISWIPSIYSNRFALLVSTLNAANVYLNHVSHLDRQVTSWLPLSEQMFKSQTRF